MSTYTGNVQSARSLCAFVVFVLAAAAQTILQEETIKRLANEADRFVEAAPRWVATETLRQASDAGESHTIVSEYGFIISPAGIREVRRVLSVDGKKEKNSTK